MTDITPNPDPMDDYESEADKASAEAVAEEAIEYTEYVFSNQQPHDPECQALLRMFVQGVMSNQVAIVRAYNNEIQDEEIILAGIAITEDGKPELYPICTVLKGEDVNKYFAPNGEGGFYDLANTKETRDAQAKMDPLVN